MFETLDIAIYASKISKKELAKTVGIAYNTFLLKLAGKFKFTLDEAFKLRKALGYNGTIEELFNQQNTA